MLNALPHKIKKTGTIILTALGLVLGFVWTYLEKVLPISTKTELPAIYLVQIVSSGIIIIVALLAFLVYLLISRAKEETAAKTEKEPDEDRGADIKQTFEEQLDSEILFHILKIKSFSQLATPRILASAVDSKAELILDRLNKLHNDQYVTFRSGGTPPTVDTDFFLSPKGFDILEIGNIQSPKSSTFIHYNDLLWLHGDPVPFCLHCSEADKKTFHMC